MIKVDRLHCCGCTACASACPNGCIGMKEDELGFQIPVCNTDSCTECGLCELVCPLTNNVEEEKKQWAYIVQNTNDEIRLQSTSGGAFTAIAELMIDKGGIVYGASYDENFQVMHVGIENKEALWKFRNSKYVQSYINGIFTEVQSRLKENRWVLFSGTPCQIEGLKSFLRQEYKKLVTVDVVCHGVASPKLWKYYVELHKIEKPDWIYFRKKHFGYKYSTMSFMKNQKEVYWNGVETDAFLRAYFDNVCDRDSCYNCRFKKRYRISDFTIWDCFDPGKFNKEYDDDKGTSSMLVHTLKGKQLLNEIIDSNYLRCYELESDKLVDGNKEMISSVSQGRYRDDLLLDLRTMDSRAVFGKYWPVSIRVKIKKGMRLLLIKTKLYKYIRSCIHTARGVASKFK